MSDPTKEVETQAQTASTEQQTGVETTAPEAPKEQETDFDKELSAIQAEKTKIARDRDNYRAGMLDAKRKLREREESEMESETPSNLDEIIERKVEEKIYSVKEKELAQREKDLIEKQTKKIKELTLALQNRSQVSTSTSQGSASEKPGSGETFWSKDQIEFFRNKGLDPNKVKENLLKTKA